ncbi:MAG: helix-turn-helix domain-containing protein [Spirochaetota bacterium]
MAVRTVKDPVFGLFDINGPWRRSVQSFFYEKDGVFRFNDGVSFYAGTQLLSRDTPFPVHRHDFLEAVIVIQGDLRHQTSSSSERTLTPYDTIFLNPSVTHRFEAASGEARIVTLSFLPSIIGYNDRVLTEYNLLDLCTLLTPFTDERTKEVRRLSDDAAKRIIFNAFIVIERIRYAGEDRQEIGKDAFRQAIKTLLEEVRSGSERTGKKVSIIDILDHLQSHYRERISQRALAERFGLTPSSLSTNFNRIAGTTLATYINRLRIEDAKKLLAETGLPIGHIALDVGFENITHFNDVFREQTGVTPTVFRKKR